MQRTRCNFSPKAPMHKAGDLLCALCLSSGPLGEENFHSEDLLFSSLLFSSRDRIGNVCLVTPSSRFGRNQMCDASSFVRPCTLNRAWNLSQTESERSEVDRPSDRQKRGARNHLGVFLQTILINRVTTERVERIRPELRAIRRGIHAT